MTDYTGKAGAGATADGLTVEHELGFDRCGRLTSLARGRFKPGKRSRNDPVQQRLFHDGMWLSPASTSNP